MGKQYADEIEKSTKFITDPVVDEYVNRIGQNIVKNSDCKVPFTIKVIDSDEINAMALPGGFFYVNSGLILAADEEAELAGVMAHETAHVCAHHCGARDDAHELRADRHGAAGDHASVRLDWISGSTRLRNWRFRSHSCSSRASLRRRPTISACSTCTGPVTIRRRSSPSLRRFRRWRSASRDWWPRRSATIRRRRTAFCTTQEEIARILPAKDDYLVTTSEFDDVKARLARIENKRRLTDSKGVTRPSLRRASTNPDDNGNSGNSSAQPGSSPSDSGDGPPTLHRRDDQN